jgi:ABC-type bacteriocin/lantibiotic exporter with double-glycine peptidase domain
MSLAGVSFEVEAGCKIGIVGPSGCGKSTILKILIGFYRSSKGQILIDNINLNDFDLHHLRQSIGTVTQEPTLFNTSIHNNILYNQSGDRNDILHEDCSRILE